MVGNLHVHSINSDGTGGVREIAAAALDAGIDFVAITDHNTVSSEISGRYGNVHVLAGQEFSPAACGHLLVFGSSR